MKAIIKQPGRDPTIIDIPNRLEELQRAVGGYIETWSPASDVTIICNEEGRLDGLPYNVTILGMPFVGTILGVGVSGDSFCDLDAEQAHFMLQLIKETDMKRLTKRGPQGTAFYPTCINGCYSDDCDHCEEQYKQCDAIAAYEDTGLTPEEIMELKKSADVPQWISVKDRLPELIPCNAGAAYSEAVVTLTSGRAVVAAIYDGERFIGAFDYWDCADTETVTHWMPATPLPEPPKEEDDETD